MRRYILAVCAVLFCGCAAETPVETFEEEVVIPVIFLIDPATLTKSNEDLVEGFNKEYQGRYKLDVEWVAGTAADYRSRIRRLNVTNELPAVITDLSFVPSLYNKMILEERLVDLRPFIEGDDEWMSVIEPEVLEACIEDDGGIYFGTIGTVKFSSTGVFWNKKLFEIAGISEFPETWIEFWDVCDKLKDSEITPLGLHTDGTAWAPMLFATAGLGVTKEGSAFMKTALPDSYNNPEGVFLTETLIKLFEYTSDDALYRDFDVAYEHFFNSEVAMLPNGYWMIEQIDEEASDDIGFAAFPENAVIASPEMSGWSVASSYDEKVTEGAVELLKYRNRIAAEEKRELMEDTTDYSTVRMDYVSVLRNNPIIIPNYQIQWNSMLQEDVLGKRLPQLINNEITVEEFIYFLDEGIRTNAEGAVGK